MGFMKEVNWNSYTFLTKPGSASAGDWAKAIEKMIAMGAAMDPELLKKGAMAHHKAIGAVTEASPAMSKADFEAFQRGNRPHDCLGAGESDNGRLRCGLSACARRGAKVMVIAVYNRTLGWKAI